MFDRLRKLETALAVLQAKAALVGALAGAGLSYVVHLLSK